MTVSTAVAIVGVGLESLEPLRDASRARSKP